MIFRILLSLAILTAVFLFKYLRVFYLVLKIPNPKLTTTLVGLTKFFTKQQDIHSTATKIINASPLVFRLFLGPYVHIVTLRPQDIEIICNKCLKKGRVYDIFKGIMRGDSLLVAKLNKWQNNRKIINHSFNQKVVNSFADIFIEQAKKLGNHMEGMFGKKNKNLMITIWVYTLRITFETLADVKLDDDVIQRLIHLVIKAEGIFVERLHSPWLNIKAIWKMSRVRKEMTTIREAIEKLIHDKVICTVKNDKLDSVSRDPEKELLFLNNLFSAHDKGLISGHDILKETVLMIPASSETVASAISFVFIALGIYPEIQDMVYKEIILTIPDSDEFTLVKIKQLHYLERVIKETLRMKPIIPYIVRKLDEDIFSEPFIFPTGCDVMIPVDHLHKNTEIWKDPLKFDPDRFLPEEVEKRHRSAYIPFSHGVRNCIGLKYAMLLMKCTIAEIVRNFEIKTLHPKEFADVDVVYTILNTPHNYSTEFIKRQ